MHVFQSAKNTVKTVPTKVSRNNQSKRVTTTCLPPKNTAKYSGLMRFKLSINKTMSEERGMKQCMCFNPPKLQSKRYQQKFHESISLWRDHHGRSRSQTTHLNRVRSHGHQNLNCEHPRGDLVF